MQDWLKHLMCISAPFAGSTTAVQTAILSFFQSQQLQLPMAEEEGVITVNSTELETWLGSVTLPM